MKLKKPLLILGGILGAFFILGIIATAVGRPNPEGKREEAKQRFVESIDQHYARLCKMIENKNFEAALIGIDSFAANDQLDFKNVKALEVKAKTGLRLQEIKMVDGNVERLHAAYRELSALHPDNAEYKAKVAELEPKWEAIQEQRKAEEAEQQQKASLETERKRLQDAVAEAEDKVKRFERDIAKVREAYANGIKAVVKDEAEQAAQIQVQNAALDQVEQGARAGQTQEVCVSGAMAFIDAYPQYRLPKRKQIAAFYSIPAQKCAQPRDFFSEVSIWMRVALEWNGGARGGGSPLDEKAT